MDSHGLHMQKVINEHLKEPHSDLTIKVEFKSEGDIKSITHIGQETLSNRHFDACYLLAGVNDLTTKYSRRFFLFNFTNLPDMVDTLTDKYEIARAKLQKQILWVVICHLIDLRIEQTLRGQNAEQTTYYQ